MRFVQRLIKRDFAFFYSCPALLWQILFLYVPLCGILIFSFLNQDASGLVQLTLKHYFNVFKPVYVHVIFNSFMLALTTASIALLIAYPVAYYLAMYAHRGRMLLLFALILPSWTNFIVQVYAWYFLLDRRGFYSQTLMWLGITKEPLHLHNTYFATLCGMVYCFLPFMIFPLYVVLEKMDKRLIEASLDLGANRFYTFLHVVLPISMPGVFTGFMLVFIPSFGEFAIPILLGGSKEAYWGTVIMEKFILRQDWASGFALACFGIAQLLIMFGLVLGAIRIFTFMRNRRRYGKQILSER